MNCFECGLPLAPNAKFCKQCGASQKPSAPKEPSLAPSSAPGRTCSQCGHHCNPQAKFCPQCGTSFVNPPVMDDDLHAPISRMDSHPLPDPVPTKKNTSTAWIIGGLVVVVIGLLAWIFIKPNTALLAETPTSSATGTASEAGKAPATLPNGEIDDRARAESLVGPMGGTPEPLPSGNSPTPATSPTAVASPSTPPVVNATTSPTLQPPVAPPAPSLSPEPTVRSAPRPAPEVAPAPAAPTPAPRPDPNRPKTLDDLLM